MQEVSQQRFEESYGFAVLLCYSETNGLRACAFNGHAYLSSFRQLRQLQGILLFCDQLEQGYVCFYLEILE